MSFSGRLKTLVLDGPNRGPHLLITGGVHGDEFEPMAAIRRLAQRVEPGSLRGKLTLVPVVNEPAFLRGERTAEDGLDLARTCPGRANGSITEQIAWELTELIRSADYYIDLHTGGTQLCVTPLAGYMLHPDPRILDIQRQMARAFNLPLIWGTDYQLNGRSLSVARDAGVPAIYCEYLGGGRFDAQGVAAYVDGCLNVLGMLGMLDRTTPASRVRHVIEDDSPGSGHMQVCNPSSLTGLFEPAVGLGDMVARSQPLGIVREMTGEQEVTIAAQQSGLVVVLRTFPRVLAGDSLAVVARL